MICTNSKFIKTAFIFFAGAYFSLGYATAHHEHADDGEDIAILASSGQVAQNIPYSALESTMDSLVPNALDSDQQTDDKKSFHFNKPFTVLNYQSLNIRDANIHEYFKGYRLGGSGTYVFSDTDDNAVSPGSVGQKTNVTTENFTMSYYRNKNLVVGAQVSLMHSHTKLNKNANNITSINKDNAITFGLFSSYNNSNGKYPYYLNGCLAYTDNRIHSVREAWTVTAASDVSRGDWAGMVEIGRKAKSFDVVGVQPFFKTGFFHCHQDSYSEETTPSANQGLDFKDFKATSWSYSAGMNLSRRQKLFGSDRSQIGAKFAISTQKVSGENSTMSVRWQSAGAGGAYFDKDTPNKRKYSFDTSVSFGSEIAKNLLLSGQYARSFNSHTATHNANIALTYNFK